jgi:hypothetical protein
VTHPVTVKDPPPPLVEDSDTAKISYSAGWATASCPGAACSANHTQAYSTTRGSRATLTFTGTQVEWIATKGPRGGKVRVFLDGTRKKTVNLRRTPFQDGVVVYTSRVLPAGSHTISIKLVRGKRVNLDAFRVTP